MPDRPASIRRLTPRTCGRPWRWRGAGSATPGPTPRWAASWCSDGRVVGRAVTAPGGRPHAEPAALDMAGAAARGATVYITLEPCCHWGRTPPCTDALIAAGVARVVIATRDPDPRVDGAGIARLRAAGIEVEEGRAAERGRRGRGRLSARRVRARAAAGDAEARLHAGRPHRDTQAGKAAGSPASSARRAAHALRGRHDAVMVGVGTVLADDPELTCRLPGYRPNPLVRVVADSRLRTAAHRHADRHRATRRRPGC